ncbi:unnamed protein product [Urochloa decumbens]|uniref:Methyltransferase type 11 domain-containing protein n=1 Tax=Urochloa decumbens TaxID=240449 RepID=A0ABC9BW01_9POAL
MDAAAAADLLDGGNGKNKPPRRRCHYCNTTAITLLMFVLTNTVSIVVSSGAGSSFLRRYNYKPSNIRLWDGGSSALLAADLNTTQSDLAASRAELAALHARVRTANELLRTLLDAMSTRNTATGGDTLAAGWKRELTGELKLAVEPHGTGTNATGGAPAAFPALGHACVRVQDDLERYMSYTPGGECPSDEALAHRLMRSGCEPLPRRRCRAPSPKGYTHPLPLPASLWAAPPDAAVLWDAYLPCKNYSCLMPATPASFDLRRRRKEEKARWARDDGTLEYSIAAVLASRPNGTVRVGHDLAGGGETTYAPGTFAARMMERGVTVVTAAVSDGAPRNSFVAARGLVSVHVTAAHHRLPFFDRTLDIVHEAAGGLGVLAGGGDDVMMMEFALFDVYRVLRPGGLFWIDHYPCAAAHVNATFARMVVERVGFRKLRWNTGRGKGKGRWYISALLEKPMMA